MLSKAQKFVTKIRDKHGDKFSYPHIEEEYNSVNQIENITIICNKCEVIIYQTPKNHKRTNGCFDCYPRGPRTVGKMNYENFEMRAIEKFGDMYNYLGCEEQFVDMEIAINIDCDRCRTTFSQKPSNHLESINGGCPNCNITSKKELISLSWEEFLGRAIAAHKDKHGHRYDYAESVYIGRTENITIRCITHGYFTQTADCHLQGNGCKYCGKEISKEKATKPLSEFMEEVYETHGDMYKYPNMGYTGVTFPILIVCRIHGEFSQIAEHHKNGSGCKDCGIRAASLKKTLTNENYVNNCELRWPGKFNYEKTKYTDSRDPVTVTCIKCKNDKTTSASYHYNRGTCMTCAPKSKGEAAIIEILRKHNIVHQVEFSLPNNKKRYDFMIPSVINTNGVITPKICVEYDGIQHFSCSERFHDGDMGIFIKKQQIDIEKTINAIRAGYAIIRIDYTFTKSEEIEDYLLKAINNSSKYNLLVSSDELYENHNFEVMLQIEPAIECINNLK